MAHRGEPVDHVLGRSRGGLSTKVHLAAGAHARRLAFTVTAGQAGDAPAFETVMSRIRVPRTGPGRPRTRPLAVLGDRAYSSRAIRSHLRRRGIRTVIPQPSDQVGHRLRRGRLGGRPPGVDREPYKLEHRRAVHQPTQAVVRAWSHEPTNSPPLTRPHSTSRASSSGPDADQRDRTQPSTRAARRLVGGALDTELADFRSVLHQFGVHPGDHVCDGVSGVVLPGERGG
ncbi:hypothetical protein CD790_22260 [Streptomyces sp. SAJ15]|nr:hypothetical protein CD790_22260 [Streptomyces sp. SAJ15]